MDFVRRSMIATSLNPYSRLQYQLQCFHEWKRLGFQVLTFNCPDEATRLREAGITREDVFVLDLQATGRELFGKPVPRIQPVLELLKSRFSDNRILLVNSDIFPALRSASIMDFWESSNGGLALTREECHAIGAHTFETRSPYRGGIDAFFMTQGALTQVLRCLSSHESAKRMAFGMPGWDYMIGAAFLSPQVGGAIMDSGVLLHLSHRESYGNMSEFAHYIGAMQSMGAVRESDASAAANEFSCRIDAECQKNTVLTAAARTIYFRPHLGQSANSRYAAGAKSALSSLVMKAPAMTSRYTKRGAAMLAERLAEDEAVTLAMALSFFVESPSRHMRFLQTLFATAFCLRCGRSARPQVTEIYPAGNQHAAALRNILTAHSEKAGERRNHVAKLFGAELIDRRIFNRRLYNYLILSCENDSERSLLIEIRANVTGSDEHVSEAS